MHALTLRVLAVVAYGGGCPERPLHQTQIREHSMNKSQLIDVVAALAGQDKKQVAETINALMQTIQTELSTGGEVTLTGFGTFKTADRPAKSGYSALAGLDLDALAGDTLLHADLHEGNLLAAGGGVRVLDWGLACQGAAWVETALFIPRLILAGHTPEQAESLAAEVPAYKSAPDDVVTGLAAVWSLFREFVARNGPEGIRESRARAAAAGRAWVEYRA